MCWAVSWPRCCSTLDWWQKGFWLRWQRWIRGRYGSRLRIGEDQIKAAPEYDETADTDPTYRDRLGGYYGETYSAIPPGTAR